MYRDRAIELLLNAPYDDDVESCTNSTLTQAEFVDVVMGAVINWPQTGKLSSLMVKRVWQAVQNNPAPMYREG